jgi:diguanylate cyclase (GGDEF)-like protein/PAS domain S-box-containing protein
MGKRIRWQHLPGPAPEELHGKLEVAEQELSDCETRFRTLVELSSDWYWILDEELRLVRLDGHFPDDEPGTRQAMIGQAPWNWPGVQVAGADFEQLRTALLEAQRFVDLEYTARERGGRLRHVSLSGAPKFQLDGQFAGYWGVARDVTKRRRAEALGALEHAVTRTIAQATTSRQILQAVMRIICESEQWETAGFFRVEDKLGTTRLVAGWSGPGMTPVAAEYYRQTTDKVIPPGGMISKAAISAKPIWVADLKESQTTWVQRVRHTGERAHLFFPIQIEAKVIGVFAFSSREAREVDENLLQTLRVISEQVGQYLQRRQAEQILRESEARFRALTDLSSDWYWEVDANLCFTRIEGRRLGDDEALPGQSAIGKLICDAGLTVDSTGGWETWRAQFEAKLPFRDVVTMIEKRRGAVRYFAMSGEPVHDRHGTFVGFRGVGRDITESKLAQSRISHMATHDDLTELPNRVAFSELLNFAIQSAQRQRRRLAVMFIDLDRFKLINDTLGHDAGDELLKAMSKQLKECLRSSDVLARLGGDEFVVLLPETGESEEVASVARKMLSAAARPILISGQEYRVTASIGISMYPLDAENEQTLMKHADSAMYLAKDEGKNNFQFYSANIKSQSGASLAMESHLRRALEQSEFTVHYQAKVDLRTRTITGVEALLRWQNPALGLVSPAQFIPLAEETGLILPIGKWVLEAACAQNMYWQRQGLAPVCMAVNLSPRQFADECLLANIARALQETGMKPELLELEITESMVILDPERAIRMLNQIKDMGVRLAIDDFGTGYSSLAQLKRFPVNTLKIDRSFIRDLPGDAEDRAITEAIITMGKTLGLTVVAEGVETQEQETFLRGLACDQTQGYYFSKPIDADKVAELLRLNGAPPLPS